MRYLNLGILAHVDAGKTSLTERLLHAAGVIDEIGSVDRGTTRTDSLELERRRGITIKAAVTAFPLGGTSVNLVDTPGHPDFIAEVERTLGVLDGVVLVVSAVEGVQAQTRVLMRAIRRLGLPTVLFVNKVDRAGADPARVLAEVEAKLTPAAFPLGGVADAGTRAARFVSDVPELRRLKLWRKLAEDSRRGTVYPVYFGSAITGAGIPELMAGLGYLLPRSTEGGTGKASGRVFKVERGASGERIAYVRMFTGALKTRDRLPSGRVTGISVLSAEDGAPVPTDVVSAGQIGVVRGLDKVRIGDRLGARSGNGGGNGNGSEKAAEAYFAPPTLETVVAARAENGRGPMFAALTQLAEQDPLIGLRYDKARSETSLSLYGEVQKEVIQTTLAEEYGVAVDFHETTPICVERVLGVGEGLDVIKLGDNPFLATVGLRIGPAPIGSGVTFGLEIELGSLIPAFLTAIEETVHTTLGSGLHGWQIPDAAVTLTRSGYWPRQSHSHGTFSKAMSSTAGDFRMLTPLVLMEALAKAGTEVCEPMHRFRLEAPSALLGTVLPVLATFRAVPGSTAVTGETAVLEGLVPAARVHALGQRIPGLTSGEGVLESAFDHFAPVSGGEVPERARWDANPLDRKEYLMRVQRGL
ncbi:TetM/TetW/TetO/TetS family tetracycline resistance ribosomal protection protein [Catenulispora sp. NF23]|uniref:elongation factor G n=1 Tax=Catenulispora pinistramenti TaxID=2705254 RepID=UPI001BABC0B3|nr:TetM/TetW/TetO/TetS family tetracycline resistance ribosomal protection protein [Catenulispora pinistramenti]MBS2533757.1 TetM/TetW/TetO/TetS family tetracycline resistance ribosomal protection protein [Catenulispora pinistramenti]